jgi:hypothetical protein
MWPLRPKRLQRDVTSHEYEKKKQKKKKKKKTGYRVLMNHAA